MRNKKLVVNLLNIGGIGILVGGILFASNNYFKMTKSQRDYLARNPDKLFGGIINLIVARSQPQKDANLTNWGDRTNIEDKDPMRNSDNNLERDDRTNIEDKDPMRNSDNNLERDDRTNTTALNLPVKNIRRTSSTGGEVVSTDYIRVVVPFGPTCGDLADRVQQVYNDLYNQGKTPVRVQFYGTDNYYSVPLKSVEKGEDKDNVFISTDIGEETENTWKTFPNEIVCRMRNASYVEYRPTGNKYCRYIVDVEYDIDRNSFGYWGGHCDESR